MKKGWKQFDIVVNMPGGSVVVQRIVFDPASAEKFVVSIDPKKGRHSLVVQEVKKALTRFEDALITDFEAVPESLKKKLNVYIPFNVWEFRQRFRKIREDVEKSWMI